MSDVGHSADDDTKRLMSVSAKKKFYRDYGKRGFDLVLSFITLVLLSPILFATYVLLRIANGKAGAFFLQERPGKDGRIFRIVKFKTMNDRKDASGKLLPDAERLTRIGRIVRLTSIDELPQLWNVLRGDMSLIGPRPLLPQYLSLYNKEQSRRHEVRPGITGWAQCHGRNAISWTEKFRLDVWYVDHVTLWVDLKVILITLHKVLVHEGINGDGQATMEAFNGNN
jgi:lipopolysaccharide/colanic/teichoic acid biosynthesis glycosyltransferase